MNDILQIVFAGIVAISTVVYAILTSKLVSETKKIRQQQITPDINLYFEKSEANVGFAFFVIENIGLGIAQNIKLEILKDFKSYDLDKLKLENLGIFNSGLRNFYPKQRFRYYFTDLRKNHEEKISDYLEIKLTYTDILKTVYMKEFHLTLDEITGMLSLSPPDSYIGRIPYELKEIRALLKGLGK